MNSTSGVKAFPSVEPGTGNSDTGILEALVTAAVGKGLYLQCLPELAGALVAGPTIDAYVIAARGGFSVELWHANGTDPFGVERFDDLATAVALAVKAAESGGPR